MKHVLPWLVLLGLLSGCLPVRRDTPTTVDEDDTAVEDAVDDAGDVSGTTGDAKGDAKDTGDTAQAPVLGCKLDADCTAYNGPCQTGTCDTTTGICVTTPAADDSNCVGVSDMCATSLTCKTGACVKVPLNCDDNNPCTVDTCDPATGCSSSTTPLPKTCGPKKDQACTCDDGDACTLTDVCVGTTCKGKTRTCDDLNACTSDACDSVSGCTFTAKPANSVCDDGDALCTNGDKCVAGVCVGTPVNCPTGGNKCNVATCDKDHGGCLVAANADAPCNDGDPCTDKDVCDATDPLNGQCMGKSKDCNDKNDCTDDACDNATGCTHTPNAATTCTAGGTCAAMGTCNAGVCNAPASACDDGNICTDDACDAKKGCVHTANTAKCNDGNACTYGESCSAGVCGGSLDVSTDDGNECTVDTCSPTKGPSWTVSGNGVGCGVGKSCTGGICQPNKAADGICPADGGLCAAADAACISTCTTKACGDALVTCDGDTGCGIITACIDVCSDAACKLTCLVPGADPWNFPTSLQIWLNIQWCRGAQCIANGWSGKPCVPGLPSYATCAAGCESAMCLKAAFTCEVTNGCVTQRNCLSLCAGSAGCEANCLADPAATLAAKSLLQCTQQLCQ
jgi:hypothetical protein